jgi:hypothetical protein
LESNFILRATLMFVPSLLTSSLIASVW